MIFNLKKPFDLLSKYRKIITESSLEKLFSFMILINWFLFLAKHESINVEISYSPERFVNFKTSSKLISFFPFK